MARLLPWIISFLLLLPSWQVPSLLLVLQVLLYLPRQLLGLLLQRIWGPSLRQS